MKKDLQSKITGGLVELLNPTPTKPQAQTSTPQEKKKNYKTVCYSLDVELLEALRVRAFYDNKKISAIVTEALRQYLNIGKGGKL